MYMQVPNCNPDLPSGVPHDFTVCAFTHLYTPAQNKLWCIANWTWQPVLIKIGYPNYQRPFPEGRARQELTAKTTARSSLTRRKTNTTTMLIDCFFFFPSCSLYRANLAKFCKYFLMVGVRLKGNLHTHLIGYEGLDYLPFKLVQVPASGSK